MCRLRRQTELGSDLNSRLYDAGKDSLPPSFLFKRALSYSVHNHLMCSVRALMLLISQDCLWWNGLLLEKETEAQQANSYQGLFLKAASMEHTFSTAERSERWGEARNATRRHIIQSLDKDNCWEEGHRVIGLELYPWRFLLAAKPELQWSPCTRKWVPFSLSAWPRCHHLQEGLTDFYSGLGPSVLFPSLCDHGHPRCLYHIVTPPLTFVEWTPTVFQMLCYGFSWQSLGQFQCFCYSSSSLRLKPVVVSRGGRKVCVVVIQSLSRVQPFVTSWTGPHGLQHARLPCPSLSLGVC